jgi:L-lysine epsilon oxidase-like protein
MSASDPRASKGLKRRDFLAGAGSFAALPLVPRAAIAQNATSSPPDDRTIARLAIFPALGICRVGNSREWFLAPEVPGMPPLADGSYKDHEQKVKKQVQRFRIYAFNAAGDVIREVTTEEARIEWTVHVANTKAAWYGFNNPLDNGEKAPGLPGQKRNQFIVGDQDRAGLLVIDPGPRTITGRSINPEGSSPAFDMVGRFWKTLDVKLGHLRTDDRGRLLVFPGDGVSRSAVPNNPIRNFSDNDGWHDDWCDGVARRRSRSRAAPPASRWRTAGSPAAGPTLHPRSRPSSRSTTSSTT